MTDPTACRHCNSKDIKQDEDVLDTWFSSWLWPLSPFGWPESSDQEKRDMAYYYPSNVLVTAPEIIFLWVARMVMAGLRFKGSTPFKDVYFNATVCDKKGRKFSKTLGNGIDPLEVIDKHGADAVRFTAVSLAPLGGRVRMDHSDFDNGARFINKIWNASRFIFRYIDANTKIERLESLSLHVSEKWLLHEFHLAATKANQLLQQYRVNDAVDTAYHFMWQALCDWGLECAKEPLSGADPARKNQTLSVLIYALDGALRLLHPVIPFITEEIWQKLPAHPNWDRPKSLTIAKFPAELPDRGYAADWEQWQRVQDVITDIRSCRMQSVIPPKQELDVVVRTDAKTATTIEAAAGFMRKIAAVKELQVGTDVTKPPQALSAVGKGYEIYLPVAGLLDIEKEKKRLSHEVQRITKIVAGLQAKLNNQDFVAKAPEEVLAQSKEQLMNMEQQLKTVSTNLASLS